MYIDAMVSYYEAIETLCGIKISSETNFRNLRLVELAKTKLEQSLQVMPFNFYMLVQKANIYRLWVKLKANQMNKEER